MRFMGLELKVAHKKGSIELEQHLRTVNQKNKHIKILENQLSSYEEIIDDLTKKARYNSKQTTEERLLDLATNFITPSLAPVSKNIKQPDITTPLDVKTELEKQSPEVIKRLAGASLSNFTKVVSKNYPTATVEEIEMAYKSVQEMSV